ncbi:glycosyltransferase [Alteromonas lipotrueiana]|uniref:glycosyltransferase n=1 Tax=Alteromonas lipotrueiana TaxID=2803815 RepID=UPI001C44C937|nr:glycosyltransferase [Alteromonas lipotrueiana]
MKLAVIAHPRHPIRAPFAGGLEAFIASLVSSYNQDIDVTLYAHPDSQVNCELVSFPLNEKTYKQYPDIVENDFLLKVMEDITRRGFDVVHNNAISSVPPLWACKYDIPILTTLHTPPYSKLKAAADLASYSPYVHYNAVSYSVAELWRPFINDDIDVVYNGVDLNQWDVAKSHPEFAFSFGRITPSKGFDLAIKASTELGLPFCFAGPVFDQRYFDDVITPLLSDKVQYLGHLTHRQINERLKKARAVVFGARWDEPFGLSTVEAMATGTPVAAFNRGAFPEIVADSGGCLATGNNVYSLAEALSRAIDYHRDDVRQRADYFPLSTMCQAYSSKVSGLI